MNQTPPQTTPGSTTDLEDRVDAVERSQKTFTSILTAAGFVLLAAMMIGAWLVSVARQETRGLIHSSVEFQKSANAFLEAVTITPVVIGDRRINLVTVEATE